MTLAPVVRLMARHKPDAGAQVSRLCLPSISRVRSGDQLEDSLQFASCIEGLISELGLTPRSLREWGVNKSEVPIIVKRAMKGPADDRFREEVQIIVKSLF